MLLSSLALWAWPVHGVLVLSDFDVVAFKFDTGETVSDGPIGVVASPAPVFDAAVNLMMLDGTIPLYLTDGPTAGAEVLFGFVDSTNWTPSDSDGNDLSTDFNSLGDRLYVRLQADGSLQVISAPDLSAGVVLASTSVALDPNKAFFLEVFDGIVRLFYDDDLLVEEPLGAPGGVADPQALGDDFVVSITTGGGDTGTATINDLSKDPKLEVTWFPRLVEPHGPDSMMALGRDVLDINEQVELAFYLTNVGSSTATDVQVQLVPPAGTGISVVGGDTREYGSLASEASTVRTFGVATSSTPVGVHELTLEANGGVTQTIETYVPVWDFAASIVDLNAGEAAMTADTPYAAHSVDVTAPEVLIDPDEPYTFLLSQLDHTVVHSEPFFGTHWGDPLIGDLELESARSSSQSARGAGTFNLTVEVKTRSGTPLVGTVIEVESAAGTWTFNNADGAGKASFPANEVSENPYTVTVKPKAPYAGLYKSATKTLSVEPGSWVLRFCYPDVPTASAPGGKTPPANAQGQNGGQGAGKKTPARPRTKGRTKVGRSVASGLLTFLGTGLIDIASSPSGPALVAASAVGAALLGGGASVAADPVEQDVFFFGQQQTPPLDPGELTLQESVEMAITIDPVITPRHDSTITTSYTYTRTTDQQIYTYTGGETLTFDKYLPLTVSVTPSGYADGQDVVLQVAPTTRDGARLSGADAIVMALIFSSDGSVAHGQLTLQDDGQAPDGTANDGAYSGTLKTAGLDGGLRVMLHAAQTGFFQETFPHAFGYELVRIEKDLIFADGFESGNTSRW